MQHYLSKHIICFIFVLVLFFIFGSFLPPLLLRAGYEQFAKLGYALYAPTCHQLAYRSFFLFGEQLFYPRELAKMEALVSYEDITGLDSTDIDEARNFYGNQVIGYKIAICQRDMAMYFAILVFIIIFSISNNRLPPLKTWGWISFGLLPILIDGGSQLFSIYNFGVSWLPVRESNPYLRMITGFSFGFLTAWFLIPRITKLVMRDNANAIC